MRITSLKSQRVMIACALFSACAATSNALVAEEKFLINALTIETDSGKNMGSASSHSDMNGFFKAQKELVNHILVQTGINPENLPPEVQRELAKPQTKSMNALVSFSTGLDALDKGNYKEAKMAFAEAVRLDPGFQLAVTIEKATPSENITPKMVEQTAKSQGEKKAAVIMDKVKESEKQSKDADDSLGGVSHKVDKESEVVSHQLEVLKSETSQSPVSLHNDTAVLNNAVKNQQSVDNAIQTHAAVIHTPPPVVVPTPVPVAPTPVPVEPTPAPVVSTPVPVEPTPAPVVSTPVPVEPTPVPVVSTSAPVFSTPAPVDPSYTSSPACVSDLCGFYATSLSRSVLSRTSFKAEQVMTPYVSTNGGVGLSSGGTVVIPQIGGKGHITATASPALSNVTSLKNGETGKSWVNLSQPAGLTALSVQTYKDTKGAKALEIGQYYSLSDSNEYFFPNSDYVNSNHFYFAEGNVTPTTDLARLAQNATDYHYSGTVIAGITEGNPIDSPWNGLRDQGGVFGATVNFHDSVVKDFHASVSTSKSGLLIESASTNLGNDGSFSIAPGGGQTFYLDAVSNFSKDSQTGRLSVAPGASMEQVYKGAVAGRTFGSDAAAVGGTFGVSTIGQSGNRNAQGSFAGMRTDLPGGGNVGGNSK